MNMASGNNIHLNNLLIQTAQSHDIYLKDLETWLVPFKSAIH